MRQLQHFGIGIDKWTRNNITAYHGSPAADKILKEGLKPGRLGTIYLSPSYEGAGKFSTNNRGVGLNPNNILSVEIRNEDKHLQQQQYFDEVNKELIQRNLPTYPMNRSPTKSEMIQQADAEQTAINRLRSQGIRGVTQPGQIQVFYPEDIVNISRTPITDNYATNRKRWNR